LVDLKREIRRTHAPPTLEGLENALREFLHQAGEPSETRSVAAFGFYSGTPPRSQFGNMALRLMIVRYNKIVRYIDRELSVEWPSESVLTPSASPLEWSPGENLVGESGGWTPTRLRRAIDCVARALILQRSVHVPSKP
jgi:hypothetical protein